MNFHNSKYIEGMQINAYTLGLVVVFSIWFCTIATALAETPPSLPEKYDWSAEHSGKHWYASSTLEDIENAFNAARVWEATVLVGQADYFPIRPMNLVGEFTLYEWQRMSINERALWLINDARTARGLLPYEGIDPYASQVSQIYTQYLFDNDTNGHTADGRNAYERLLSHAQIDESCPRYVQESLAYSGGLNSGFMPLPISVAVYNWLYTGTAGHRASILYQGENFIDDTGVIGAEGVIGIGFLEGQGYDGFGGIFKSGVQITSLTYYDPGLECANIPAVPPAQNQIILNEIDYVGNDAFVELYNSGETSISLRDYVLNTGNTRFLFPEIALKAGEYVAVCSADSKASGCAYQFGGALSWGEEAQLLLNEVTVDAVPLVGDDATVAELGISRQEDGWRATCTTAGSDNTTYSNDQVACDQPYVTIEQAVELSLFEDRAEAIYTISMTSDGDLSAGSNVMNMLPTSYECDNKIPVTSLGGNLFQGSWQCRVTYPLAYESCEPAPLHRVISDISGQSSIENDLVIELTCENAPAAITVSQEAETVSSGFGAGDSEKISFIVSATNTGGRATTFLIEPTPHPILTNHACTGDGDGGETTVAPGETATWNCTADAPIEYEVCEPKVWHRVKISSPDLDQPVNHEATANVTCNLLPRYTQLSVLQTVTVAQEDDVATLRYDLLILNIGGRSATLALTTMPDTQFIMHECDALPSEPLAANSSITVTCTATASIENSSCAANVSHAVEITSTSLEAPVQSNEDSDLLCNPIPLAVTMGGLHVESDNAVFAVTTILIMFLVVITKLNLYTDR